MNFLYKITELVLATNRLKVSPIRPYDNAYNFLSHFNAGSHTLKLNQHLLSNT